MKKIIISFFIIALLLLPIQVLAIEDNTVEEIQSLDDNFDGYGEEIEYPTEFYRAQIIKVREEPLLDEDLAGQGFPDIYQVVELEILDGKFKGEKYTIDHINMGSAAYDIWVKEGDKVMIFAELTEGKDSIVNVYISDFVRWPHLRNLTILFIILLIIIGKWQGVKSLIGLGVTALSIVYFYCH